MIGGIAGVGSFGMGPAGAFYRSRLTENIRSMRDAQQAPALTVRKAAPPETPVQPVKAVRPVSRDEVSVPELAQRLENDAAAMAGRMRTRYGEVDGEGIFVEAGGARPSPVLGPQKDALEGRLSRAEDALALDDPARAADVLDDGAPALPGLPDREGEIPGLLGREDEDAASGLPGPEDMDGPGTAKTESAQEAAEKGRCETCEKRKYQDGSDDPGVSFKTPTNIKPEQAPSAVRGHEMEHVVREQAKAKREGREVVSQDVTMHTAICPECGRSYVSGGTTRTVTKAVTDDDVQQEQEQEQEAQEPAALTGKR
nr:hypothetical protein [uncultured Oscillibacter sp.]